MKRTSRSQALPVRGSVAQERRARILALIEALPEATVVAFGDHLSLEVRRKRFGWYLDNHHGDGRLALNCKAPPGTNKTLAAAAPDKFHVPKYVGHRGWVGLWLDQPKINWQEVESVLMNAY